MTQRLLLIGGKTEIVRRASGLSSEVFLVQRPEQFEAIQLHLAKNIYFSQFASEENIVDVMLAIHAVLPFSAVISLTEHGMSVAAAIAHKLSLPRSVSPSSVDMTRDKLEMRRMLQRTGQHTCKFFEVNCRADLEAASAYLGYPFIVKPADGVGSVNVALISDATTVNEIAAHGRLIAEEFIPGDEYSVETFSFSGHHVLIGCTRKTLAGENSPGPFVEIAHEFPGPLSTGDIGAVREVVFSLLVNLGITDGPAHTEIKICNGDIAIIETHTRTGGDSISDLVDLATELHPETVALKWSLGQISALEQWPTSKRSAAIRFFQFTPGEVIRIDGVEEARLVQGVERVVVELAPGDIIPRIRKSSDRRGYVICTSHSTEEANQRAKDAMSFVNVHIKETQ